MKKYYMHTINGRPAAFHGSQICYWWHGAKKNKPKMCTSLAQIRSQQKKTKKYREKLGCGMLHDYGYIIVGVK